jgi:hypothetical protein
MHPSSRLPKGGTRHGNEARRTFLRKAGITGAVTAAFIGAADVIGLGSASAAGKPGPRQASLNAQSGPPGDITPDASITCTHFSCGCGNNGSTCCPSTSCCYHCSGICASGRICVEPGGSCPSSLTLFC